jgi:amino acid adenylation domain-containing protein
MERQLARIWSELLQVERVGRHDNFFELGGHSLLAVRVVSKLRQTLGVELPLTGLFTNPVLADLARKVEQSACSSLPPITVIDRDQPLELSFAQQRLWFLSQMEGVSQAYNMPAALRLSGQLDRLALRCALDRIVSRHEILRTTFVMEESQPVQRIAPDSCGFALQDHNLCNHSRGEEELRQLALAEARAPFDLEQGPLIRGRLVELGESEHVLLITMHHIVSDGWSMGVLVNELSSLYAAYQRGEADPLTPLAIQYADYAAWQRRWLSGDILRQQSAYWQSTLKGAPELVELPSDRPRPAQQDHSGASLPLQLDEQLTRSLKALGKRHGTTLFMTLLAAWGSLLSRLSGQSDIVIGAPVANRSRAELEPLVGFFVNTLALRLDLADSPSVGQLLQRVKEQTIAAQQHQDLPFEQVVELAKPVRSLSHTPLFQVVFNWNNTDGGEIELPGLTLATLDGGHHVAKFDLTLNLTEKRGLIAGELEYATSLFDRSTIERYIGYLHNILKGMTAAEEQSVDQLPLLSPAERQQLLVEWNATQGDYPRESCIHQLFEQQAADSPHALAVVCAGKELTYGELNRRANQLAHHLRSLGVKPDSLVALCVERSLEMVVGLLAILKAGGCYVPLDPAYPGERLAHMLQDSSPVAVLTHGIGEGVKKCLAAAVTGTVPVIDLMKDATLWETESDSNPELAGLTPRHLAYVIYTSGSTGLPKGVMVEHRGVCNLLAWYLGDVRLRSDDAVLLVTSHSFDLTQKNILGPLLVGARLHLAAEPFEPHSYLQQMERAGITLINLTPSAFHALIDANSGNQIGGSCRVVLGGEPIQAAKLLQLPEPRPEIINHYGPTECSDVVACHHLSPELEIYQAGSVPLGKPVPNTSLYLLDPAGQPVPVGVAGEIHIGGVGVARGYLNRPGLTAERFLPDPFSSEPDARLYRSGDLGRWLPDGTIEFLGRNDFQVKIRGFRIELGEIEACLAQHPAIREAVVLAREDSPGDKRLVAYYTLTPAEDAPGLEILRSHLLANLPEYMVPAAYVLLPVLPLSPNGKLDRTALSAPDGAAYAVREYAAPVGEIEARLAGIWAEMLQVERVGRHDNFFELGGHSLLAITLISRMRQAGLQADVRDLFATPTLAALAAAAGCTGGMVDVPPNLIPADCTAITPGMLPLVQLTSAEIDRVVAAVPGGAPNIRDIYPLAPLQEGILFHHIMATAGDPYLMQVEFACDSRSRLEAFLPALQAVIDRHDILRTAVLWEGLPEPVQVVLRQATLLVEELSLDPAAGDIVAQLRERFDPRHYRIDLEQAPLLRVFFAFDADNSRWVMLFLFHHLIMDHTALEVLQQEVQAHLAGRAGELPAPLPYRNYVAQARLGISREEHESFFRKMLADVDEATLPFGLTDVQGDGSAIVEGGCDLDGELCRRLRENARSLGVGPASLFHLAWAQVLARVSGRDDVVFGTVLFGRLQGGSGAENVPGLFINTLPLRISLGDEPVVESVRQTHKQLAGLLRHEHAPLSLAQRCSGVGAPAPLFSALLNYRHTSDAANASGQALPVWEGIDCLGGEERSNYPFTLCIDDRGEAFSLLAQVQSPLDPLRVCSLVETAVASLVAALDNAPSTSICSLEVLNQAERQRVLVEWNATDAAYPLERCIHELFEQQAAGQPESVAVVCNDEELSYGELNSQANKLAHHLRSLGVGPDAPVAICVERSPAMVVGLLAILKAGGAYVPLDPAYPGERLSYMLADSKPVALLTHGISAAVRDCLATAVAGTAPLLDLESDAGSWQGEPAGNPALAGLTPAHLAYIIYTSGSTGQPKGVMIEHRNLANLISWHCRAFNLTGGTRSSSVASIGFDAATWEIWPPLCVGGALLLPPAAHAHNPEALLEWWASQELDVSFLPTPMAEFAFTGGLTNPGLSTLLIGGDRLRQLPPQPQTFALVNNYGPTETTVVATSGRIDAAAESLHIGRPIANTRIYLLDPHGQPVPPGVAGEIYIGGAGVARGYLNRPDLTAERFLADPFSSDPGARLYKSGDLARYLANGDIEFLGRNDFQVKLRGFRIELGEIEARLAEHPAIRDAVVLAREESPGEKRLVAYYTTSIDSPVAGAEELRSHLSSCLPDYMVPAAYVALETLPLTANGKLDRKSLPAPAGAACAARGYEPPEGELETALAAIWAGMLGVERVGRHDNFFELGGHSLLAVRIVSHLRQQLGVELSLTELFNNPVLSDLARKVEQSAIAAVPPITTIDRDQPLELSFAQQRLWFLSQMEGVSQAYNMPAALRLSGRLDRLALRRALDRIVSRHEILRTTFAREEGQPVQRIAPESCGFALLDHNLSHHSRGEDELRQLALVEARSSFDLEHGPLIRGRLIELGESEHVLLITMHHIVSDGWSMGVLRHELSSLYAAYQRGEADPLPPLAIQYADYAAWQRRWLSGDILRQQSDYWQSTLAGAPELVELPTDRPRPAQQDHSGASLPLELDEELTSHLKALGKRHGTTLFMTILAAWGTLLSRLSGQSDIVIGAPVANRSRAELEPLVGFFVNTLALRLDLADSPTVSQLLQRVKAQTVAAQQHQDLPFEQVVELAKPVRSLSHTPLFQVVFNWNNNQAGEMALPGLTLATMDAGYHVAKFDLTLNLAESGGRIVGELEYATSLFERSTIERYIGYLHNILEGMTAAEEQSVDQLPLLSQSERQRILVEWNATQGEYPRESCIHQLFEQQAADSPHAIAVVYKGKELTYGELNRRANQLAHYLRSLGVKPDAPVALCVERSLEMVVGLLAILKAGGGYVPLDPAYPSERLAYMLADSAPLAVLTHGISTAVRDGITATVAGMAPIVDLESDTGLWAEEADTNPELAGLTPRHLAYVIYTSGSTGMPKGVMVEHGNVMRLFAATKEWFHFDRNDVWTMFHSYAFDFSVWEIWGALLHGGRLIVVPQECTRSPEEFYHLVCRSGVTILNQTPSAFRQLVAAQAESREEHRLRLVIFGGEALETATLKPWYAHNGNRSTQLVNMYGITETTVHVTYRPLQRADSDRRGASPIGCRIPDLRVYLLDPHGEPVPIGVAGEMYVGGAGVARGYLNRPELTTERFLADPFSSEPGARLYRSGDLGRWLPDGEIEFLGRNDFQVKIRGFRIELGEIEARLAEYPAIREAVVLAREDRPGEKRLVAYYTLTPGAAGDGAPAVDSLRSHLLANLPEYMVPAAYVLLAKLPLTTNGKLDRKGLPAPAGAAYAARGYEAPQGEIETTLAEIWAEMLQVERVGRHDNFFELGGHSLLVVGLMSRMRQAGLQADVRDLFATPTLASLAVSVGGNGDMVEVPANLIPLACSAITPGMLPLVQLTSAEIDTIVSAVPGGVANVQDIYPLAPLQEGILFHYLMSGEGDPFLLPGQFAFDSRSGLDAFLPALQAVIDRHDILRTAVLWEGLPEPVQVVLRQAPLMVEEVSLDLADGDIAGQLRDRFDPRRYRLDLTRAPLLRLFIAYDEPNCRWVMHYLFHHLVMDHTALEAVQQEVLAHIQGEAGLLPPPVPYRTFVAQARLGVSRAEHETFFKEMLGGVDEATAPFGLTDVQGDGSEILEADLHLDSCLAKRLRESARLLGVTAASLFHLAWAQVLARVSGRDDVVFGTVLFGRMQGGTGSDRAIGLFINTLPLRIRVGEESVEESVKQTHTLLAQLLRHEHAPLSLAQRCSSVAAPLPLFSALLNYRHTNEGGASADPLPAWKGMEYLGGEERTNYPFTLSVDDLGEGFALTAQVAASLDPRRICGFMATALASLVSALENAPATPLCSLEVLSRSERQQLLEEWNVTASDYASDQCIHELFEQKAAQHPESVAVACAGKKLSYAELNNRANKLAHYLRTLGVRPDTRVAICVERSLEMVVGLLAILKAGGGYLPLDPGYPPERLTYMLADSAPVVVLTHGEVAAAVRTSLAAALPGDTPLIDLDSDSLWEAEPAVNPDLAGLTPEHLAYVIYTSGSTGLPKGVMVEHRAVNRLIVNTNYIELQPDDRVAQASNISFDAATFELWGALLHGAQLVVIDRQTLLSTRDFAARLREGGISVLFLTTALFNQFAQESPSMFSGLRYLLFGGEAVDPRWVRQVLAAGPPQQLLHVYGPTETTTFATSHRAGVTVPGTQTIPIGRPIANTRIYLLDSHGQPVPQGVAGEIFIGGAGVARGYLNRPELTRERFLVDPFADEPGSRMYKTGDLARYLPDGSIEFLGRNDFQVKIRGFRIELGEIEARLAEHAAIRDAVVLAREESPGEKRLVAYYTLAAGTNPVGAEELRSHLLASLPEYMVPAAYVLLTGLPLTPNGKLDRKSLPAPDGGAYAGRGYKAPEGEMEIQLARIWSELLQVERVGRHDNFFELGGHSLLAVRVVSKLRQTLGVELPLTGLFTNPVLADLARVLRKSALSAVAAITVIDRDQPLELSFAQQRLWFLSQMEGVSRAYNMPAGLRLSGELDRTALRRALDRIIARHEILRTTFTLEGTQPVQRIAPPSCGFSLEEHDLSRHSRGEEELRRLAETEARAEFDLQAGPLIRGRLITLGESEQVLLITMHHIVSDGWSIGVLRHELGSLYQAYCRGESDPLPALSIQYADYAAWQRRWLSGDILQTQSDYWRSTLAGAPALLELPTDRPRPLQQDHSGATIPLELDEQLTRSLKTLGKRHGTTLFMTLLTAWGVLLSRLSGQSDIVIGAPVANRTRTELEPLVGFFVNTLALRLEFGDNPTVVQALQRVKAQTVAAQQHQDLPFEQVVEIARPTRSLSHTPLFQVVFNWNNNEAGEMELPGLTLSSLAAPQTVAKFDLTLNLSEAGERIVGELEYATSLFDHSTIERYRGYLHSLLQAMAGDEQQAVELLPLLSQSERQQLLVDWNATATDYPDNSCIHELFEERAAAHPAAIAVVCDDKELTYHDLNTRANKLAHHLRRRGVKPDALVAICVERSLEMVVGLLAILKAGGGYVPLDPAYPLERLSYMLADSAPVVVLTHGAIHETVKSCLTAALSSSTPLIDLDGDAWFWEEEPDTNPALAGLTPGHLAYVIYTSGSTGKPKGVMVEHGNLVNLIGWHADAFSLTKGSRSSSVASIGFDAATWEIWPPLSVGGLLLLSSAHAAHDPEALLQWWQKQELDVSFLPTPMAEFAFSGGTCNRTLGTLLIGGDRLRQLPPQPRSFALVNNYGPTETTVVATSGRIEAADAVLHIGRPIANTRIYLLDPHGQPVPIGVTGEMYIGGAGVARGYLNRPELTRERFVADPFAAEPGGRMYRTGDLARYLQDGSIEFLGRNDFQVKIRGFRIELGEIEARLAEHAAIRDAVVLAREDNSGEKRLVAYYTTPESTDHAPGAEALRTHLLASLPEYMVPAAYVLLPGLPLTSNGKLDRKALPAPDGAAYAGRGYEAPQGELEVRLAQIWAEMLQVERVGRHDNFFELGGHSLLAVSLIGRMREEGLEVDVPALFVTPTLAALAEVTEEFTEIAL